MTHLRQTWQVSMRGVRALLAEDNEVNRLVASELLQRVGCVCTMVVNGKEAVEAAHARPARPVRARP